MMPNEYGNGIMYIFTASLGFLFLKWVFNIFCSLLVSTVVQRWQHFQQYTVMTYLCLLYLALCHCLHTFYISTLLNIVWYSKILCGESSFLLSLPAELITSWSWNEGTAIPQNHRNHSSSNSVTSQKTWIVQQHHKYHMSPPFNDPTWSSWGVRWHSG